MADDEPVDLVPTVLVCDRCRLPAEKGPDGRYRHVEPADGVICEILFPRT